MGAGHVQAALWSDHGSVGGAFAASGLRIASFRGARIPPDEVVDALERERSPRRLCVSRRAPQERCSAAVLEGLASLP